MNTNREEAEVNMKVTHHFQLEKCIDCTYCNAEKMKCYPNDIDCHSEYDLYDEDLITPHRCDFFIAKE